MSNLDKQQYHAFNLYKNGYNLFISGGGGSGKSYLVKIFREYSDNMGVRLVVTSTTGISALNINGKTIYSWAGLTPNTNLNDEESFIQNIHHNHSRLNNYLYTDILIIDEISMLSKEIFEFLNNVCKKIRHRNESFGGIQIILVGDFYQLPPINQSNVKSFAFQSFIWDKVIDFTILLESSHRQNDDELVCFLNKVRIGIKDIDVEKKLKQFTNNISSSKHTHLYPNKINVEVFNLVELEKLPGESIIIEPDIIYKDSKTCDFSEDELLVGKLVLKPGALVIINKNIDLEKKIVNGTQGIFKKFQDKKAVIITNDGREHNISKSRWEFSNYYVEQYPICLAWALTIHKSQGMGIDNLTIDIGNNVFEDGQSYVALSRSTNSNGLCIKNYSLDSIKCNSVVNNFYNNLHQKSNNWYKSLDNNRVIYTNIITGITTYKIPIKGNIVSPNVCDIDDQDIYDMYHNYSITCDFCGNLGVRNEYNTWFNVKICTICVSNKYNYRQINRREIQTLFNLSDNKVKKLLENTKFKPQKNIYNPRFGKIKIYFLKSIIEKLQHDSISTLDTRYKISNIDKKKTEKKELKINKKKDRIDLAFNLFNNKRKSISQIAKELDYSNSTIESYLVEAFKMKYEFNPEILVNIGMNKQIIEDISYIYNDYLTKCNKPPNLKYIKDNLKEKNKSYLVIKLSLVKLFKI